MTKSTSTIAPGPHIELRGVVWRVARVDYTSTDSQARRRMDVSEIVRDQAAIFLKEFECHGARGLDPRKTRLLRRPADGTRRRQRRDAPARRAFPRSTALRWASCATPFVTARVGVVGSGGRNLQAPRVLGLVKGGAGTSGFGVGSARPPVVRLCLIGGPGAVSPSCSCGAAPSIRRWSHSSWKTAPAVRTDPVSQASVGMAVVQPLPKERCRA